MVKASFSYDNTGAYTNQKCFIITNADHYLLGILNSATTWRTILEGSPGLRGGYAEPRKDFIAGLLIPDASEADRDAISSLVQQCLDAKGVGCEAWEREIDERVAALYGLSEL